MSTLAFLPFVIPVATNIITLLYLGINFEVNSPLDPEDWKRKWILILAYLQVIGVGFLFVYVVQMIISLLITTIRTGFYRDMSNIERTSLWAVLFLMVIFCVFSMMTSIFTILYLGPSFETAIDSDDWKRKWIIFFSWLSLCFQAILFLLMAFLPVIFVNYRTTDLIEFY
jgi:hypothetical protein